MLSLRRACKRVAPATGFGPATSRLTVGCSCLLSYAGTDAIAGYGLGARQGGNDTKPSAPPTFPLGGSGGGYIIFWCAAFWLPPTLLLERTARTLGRPGSPR